MKYIWIFVFVLSFAICSSKEEDEYSENKSNDFKMLFRDVKDSLGLDQILDTTVYFMRTNIRIGQSYTWQKFQKDCDEIKSDPSFFKILYFTHRLFWVCISQTGVTLIGIFKRCETYLLRFLKSKCDIYLGADAALHPWNMMMEKDEQNISFLVFVYGLALSLVLIKLLSWWNFMVYLAICLLTYSFGGAHMILKWLLCITALFWLIFDTVIKFPLHTAVGILAISALSYLWYCLPGRRRRAAEYTDGVATRNTEEYQARDYRNLNTRLDSMEKMTTTLYNRMEQLSKSVEQLSRSVSDEEDI